MIYEAAQLFSLDVNIKVATQCTRSDWTLWCFAGTREQSHCLVFVKTGSKPSEVLHRSQTPWTTSNPVTSLSFSPCTKWLLISTSSSLFVLPNSIAYDIQLTESDVTRPWMTNDITEITKIKFITCSRWWTSFRGDDYAVITCKKSFKIIDLVTGETKVNFEIPAELCNLEVTLTSNSAARVCMLTSRSGNQWIVRLEYRHLPRLRSLTQDEESSRHGFEALDLDILPPVDIIANRSEFCPQTCSKQLPRSVILRLHPIQPQRTLLSCYDSNTGVLKLLDAAADLGLGPIDVQETPLFVYGLPRQCSDIRITDRLLIAVYPALVDGKKSLQVGIFLRQHAHASPDSVNVPETALQRAKLAEFPLDGVQIMTLSCQRSKVELGETVWKPVLSDRVWSLRQPVQLPEVTLVTEKSVIVCSQMEWAENEFLTALMSTYEPSSTSKMAADWLGIGLKLDLATLYRIAGEELLSRSQVSEAADCFHHARMSVQDKLRICNNLEPSSMLRFLQQSFNSSLNNGGELNIPLSDARVLFRSILICACASVQLSSDSEASFLQDFLSRMYDKWMVPPNLLIQPESILVPMAQLGRVPELLWLARRSDCLPMAFEALASTKWGCDSAKISGSGIIEQDFLKEAQVLIFQTTVQCITSSDLDLILPNHVTSIASFASLCFEFLPLFSSRNTLKHLLKLTDSSTTYSATMQNLSRQSRYQTRTRNLSMSLSMRLSGASSLRESAADSAVTEDEQLRAIEESPLRSLTSSWLGLFIEILLELSRRKENKVTGIDCSFIDLYHEVADVTSLNASLVANSPGFLECSSVQLVGGRDYLVLIENGDVSMCIGDVKPQTTSWLQNGGHRIAKLSCGTRHAVMQMADSGKLMSVGDNSKGQLGIGQTENKIGQTKIPMEVATEKISHSVSQIACGHFHTVVLLSNGLPLAWGWGVFGQLGNQDIEDQFSPANMILPAASTTIEVVSAGLYHSVLLSTAGQLLVCGDNHFGQLGVSEEVLQKSSTLTPVPGVVGSGFSAGLLHSTYFHTIFVDNDDEIGVWGHAPYMRKQGGRRPGQPTWADTWSPQKVHPGAWNSAKYGGITSIRSGANHSLLQTQNGHLFAIGKNLHGQLGNGNKRDCMLQLERVHLPKDCRIVDAFCEDSFSGAVTSDSHILVWGRGSHPLSSADCVSEDDFQIDCASPRQLFTSQDKPPNLKSQFSMLNQSYSTTRLLPLLRAQQPLLHRKNLINCLQQRAAVEKQPDACAVFSDLLLVEGRLLQSLFWRRRQLLLCFTGTTNDTILQTLSAIVRFYISVFKRIESETLRTQETNAGLRMLLHIWTADFKLPLVEMEYILSEFLDHLAASLVKLVLSESSEFHFSLNFTLQLLQYLLRNSGQLSRCLPSPKPACGKFELRTADLRQWTKDLANDESFSIYTDFSETEQQQLVVFKCGHHFSRKCFFDVQVEELCSNLDRLDLPVTSKLAKLYYTRDKTLLTCPECLLNNGMIKAQ